MDQELVIRLATIEDVKKVFELSNDDVVRANSINQDKIKWEEHVNWFRKKIIEDKSFFYVAELDGMFCGYCRLEKVEQFWIVTIHVSPNYRNKGIGKQFIEFVTNKHKEKNLVAYVKCNNKPSCRLFEKCGYINLGTEQIDAVKCYKFKKAEVNIIAISNHLYDNSTLFKKENIEYITSKSDLTVENLKNINPKYVFFPHWSYIIPAEIYEHFNCIIFHMTDLPFGRGGSPLQNLIERGIYKTKISAIQCVKELDAGDIYLKKDLDISNGSASEIYTKVGEIVSSMIDEIISTNPTPKKQAGEVIEFKRRKPEQSCILKLIELRKIYDYIRMLDAEGYPKAYIENEKIKYEFKNAKLENGKIIAQVEIGEKEDNE